MPCSIAERRVPELIPVLGSQPAGDVSHKPGGRLKGLTVQFIGTDVARTVGFGDDRMISPGAAFYR